MMPKIAYFDCRAGVSAPHLLAALLDAGVSLDAVVETLNVVFSSFELEAGSVDFAKRGTRSSISCREKLSFTRYLNKWRSASMDQSLILRAEAIVKRLQTAEKALQKRRIALSPLTSGQIFIEIVCVVTALHLANVRQVYISPLPLSSTILQLDTDFQASPDPFVEEILESVHALWQPSVLESTPVTPVAAAILAELAVFERPVMTLERTGYGFAESAPQHPSPVTLYLGQLAESESLIGGMESDLVTVIETHIDTMTGELLGALLDRLLEAGALDVGYTPLQMKKNRPATRLTVLCPPALGEDLALLLLRETNTLGLRIQQMQRRKAQRRQERIETSLGPMLIKIKSLGHEIISISPEYEECLRLSKAHNLPLASVYEVARNAAQSFIIKEKEVEHEEKST